MTITKLRKRKKVSRLLRTQGEPYLRISCDSTKYQSGRKRWCIRFGNKEYGYPKYLAQKAGIELNGKRIIYNPNYDFSHVPTLEDIIIINTSEYFKSIYIHTLPKEIQSAIHSIIELSKKINYELRNHTN